MLGKERKREGKLTVPQVASKQNHYGEEESLKKLSEVYLSLYLPRNRAKVLELARVGEYITLACHWWDFSVGIYLCLADMWSK